MKMEKMKTILLILKNNQKMQRIDQKYWDPNQILANKKTKI